MTRTIATNGAVFVGFLLAALSCAPAPTVESVSRRERAAPAGATADRFMCVEVPDHPPSPGSPPDASYPDGDVIPGLYRPADNGIWKPFDFVGFLHEMSRLDPKPIALVGAWNQYTVGMLSKPGDCISPPGLEGNSHFMNPFCELANAWFGVQMVLDDAEGKGRSFMLKDHHGRPDHLDNIRREGPIQLTEMDQKLIVCISHWWQKGYDWKKFQEEFQFRATSVESEKASLGGNEWLRVSFSANTTAALPDLSQVSIPEGWFFHFVGLPTRAIFRYVDPWYPVTLGVETYVRYVDCSSQKFWAVLYFNGATIRTKQGEILSHWEKLRARFREMAAQVKICER